MIRIVRAGEHRVVPWKNGRGSTVEIAIHPPGATVAGGFDWRVSMAAVTEDGPFSSFPGIDRTLVLLDEGGLDLDGPDGTIALPGRFAVARFDGGAPVAGRLRGGPVRDLNVMVRRAAYAHEAELVRVEGPTAVRPAAVLLVVALEGAITAEGAALAVGELAIGGAARLSGSGLALVVRLRPA